ncbi:common pilus major fimbrillin subunit EcpA [Klebsiella oxytoca]|uniref:common pilus major fimbrillin subunit EcpA n=1 Tax=Klebsiella oxytoca TaxID=571 RepID=UPI0022480598|nr:common pilus major fimbrillin subunit EcpA [Klebsiella oxytoca]MCW9445983.1 fimbrial protein [Klebsiella oxytoca]
MKYQAIVFALTAALGISAAQAAEVTAQSVATWQATAKKDTTSKLVVTPIGSLSFQYAEGIDGFNTQNGLFDVAITGETTATAFKLTSRLVTNTLTQLDTSGSTLNVGVTYYGEEVNKTTPLTMIDTSAKTLGGNLSPVSAGYKLGTRSTAQDAFTFSIIGGTTDGSSAVTNYKDLPDGLWTGDVSVEFNATWTTA